MSSPDFKDALRRSRVIAIVRGDFEVAQYLTIAQVLFEAGIPAVELTIEKPNALEAIARLSREGPDDLWIGAGTVRTGESARKALEVGARYLISPGFVRDVAEVALAASVPYLPGVLTPSEVETAVAAGLRTVKLFPAKPLGPAYLEALKAPLADVEFVPTGGIKSADARQFIEAGALAVGLGSSLTGVNADRVEIEERAGRLLESLRSGAASA